MRDGEGRGEKIGLAARKIFLLPPPRKKFHRAYHLYLERNKSIPRNILASLALMWLGVHSSVVRWFWRALWGSGKETWRGGLEGRARTAGYSGVRTTLEDHEEVAGIIYWINLCLNLMGIILSLKSIGWKRHLGRNLNNFWKKFMILISSYYCTFRVLTLP